MGLGWRVVLPSTSNSYAHGSRLCVVLVRHPLLWPFSPITCLYSPPVLLWLALEVPLYNWPQLAWGWIILVGYCFFGQSYSLLGSHFLPLDMPPETVPLQMSKEWKLLLLCCIWRPEYVLSPPPVVHTPPPLRYYSHSWFRGCFKSNLFNLLQI